MNDPIEATRSAFALRAQSEGRPFVCLSYAQSLDGSITAEAGTPYPISGSQSLKMTHQLRAAHESILIGIGTALADDPQLTVRLVEGNDPAAVILDSELRLPADSKLFTPSRRIHIFCARPADDQRASALTAAGATIYPVSRDSQGLLDIRAVLSELYSLGYLSVMVEGGATVITHLLHGRLVDWIVLTIAPVLLGGLRLPFEEFESRHWTPVSLQIKGSTFFDHDLVIWGNPDWEAR